MRDNIRPMGYYPSTLVVTLLGGADALDLGDGDAREEATQMGGGQPCTVPVLVVRSDGSVGVRMGEATTKTPGLFVVADCPVCAQPAGTARHMHRRRRVQTV